MGAHGGTFARDLSRAEEEKLAATFYGASFWSDSGFATHLKDSYVNGTIGIQTLCGSTEMPGVPILYNNTW